MNELKEIFNFLPSDLNRLQELAEQAAPRSRYIIAITPRSGSTYLCDRVKATGRLGCPEELLGQLSLKNYLKKIPARNPDEYLRNAMRIKKTANNISGLKASWFQFEKFIAAMDNQDYLIGFKFIYLTRRDLAAQAVSLYKATASSVFHTDKKHDAEPLKRLNELEYDYEAIKLWYEHIVAQEQGWKHYFYQHRIFPLSLTYEDIENDLLAVLKHIAAFVGVKPERIHLPEEPSAFQKISDSRNQKWARQFVLDSYAQQN